MTAPVTLAGAAHVLDTDVCIDVLRGLDADRRRRVARLAPLAITTVTVAELVHGALRARRPEVARHQVDRLVESVEVLPLDTVAASHAGDIRAHLARVGTPIGPYDVLIAAVARAHGQVLVTGNVREFGRVPGLGLEAW